MRVHSHYENLKVARDAPPAVIRAAYKAMAQRYHPDRNPGDSQALEIMSYVNTAYDVLSDPDKRREHDAWIAEAEAQAEAALAVKQREEQTISAVADINLQVLEIIGRWTRNIIRFLSWVTGSLILAGVGYFFFLRAELKPEYQMLPEQRSQRTGSLGVISGAVEYPQAHGVDWHSDGVSTLEGLSGQALISQVQANVESRTRANH